MNKKGTYEKLSKLPFDSLFRFIYVKMWNTGIMFANMAFATPLPGKEEEIKEIMLNFAKELQGSPGLQRVHVMKEMDGSALLGISMWESEEAFNSGMARANNAPSSGAKSEAVRQSPTVVRKFVEVTSRS